VICDDAGRRFDSEADARTFGTRVLCGCFSRDDEV
jgi:hypothetical protein